MRSLRDQVFERLYASIRRTDGKGRPRTNPLALALQDLAALRWNMKVMGAAIARELYAAGRSGGSAPIPAEPRRVGLAGRLCAQADIESEWLRYWCGRLQITPHYHRKVWEVGFVLQALWEAGVLKPGAAGLGFACGVESLPSYYASLGINVLATDIPGSDLGSDSWKESGQHSGALAQLHYGHLVDRARFDALCDFRPVDMNDIPADLYGKFDFCWSMCSFEHAGSIRQGLDFVRNSVRCLKPGGIAVHTAEFNVDSEVETIDLSDTVLFQKRHFDDLARALAADGHAMAEMDYATGNGVLDMFIDIPPYPPDPRPLLVYPEVPHLRLNVAGFAATSVGIMVRAAGTPA